MSSNYNIFSDDFSNELESEVIVDPTTGAIGGVTTAAGGASFDAIHAGGTGSQLTASINYTSLGFNVKGGLGIEFTASSNTVTLSNAANIITGSARNVATYAHGTGQAIQDSNDEFRFNVNSGDSVTLCTVKSGGLRDKHMVLCGGEYGSVVAGGTVYIYGNDDDTSNLPYQGGISLAAGMGTTDNGVIQFRTGVNVSKAIINAEGHLTVSSSKAQVVITGSDEGEIFGVHRNSHPNMLVVSGSVTGSIVRVSGSLEGELFRVGGSGPGLASSAGTANMLVVSSSIASGGRVAIGYTGSSGILDISKDSANTEVVISSYHDTEATTPKITFRKSDGSAAAPALVDDDAVLGTIAFQGYDGSGWEEGARIEARIDGTPSDGSDLPTELTFWTTPDASATAVERMAIDNAGNVGIGIGAATGIGANFHVHDASGQVLLELSTDAIANSVIEIVTDRDGTPVQARIGVDQSDGLLRINHGSGFDGTNNGIAINSSGYLGIGVGMSDFDAIHQVEIRPDEVSATTTLAGAVTNGLALHMGNGVGKDEFAPALSWFTDDGNIDSSERTIGAITCVAAEAFDATNDSGADMAFWVHKIGTDGGLDLAMVIQDDTKIGMGIGTPAVPLHIKMEAASVGAIDEILRLECADDDNSLNLTDGNGVSINFYVPYDTGSGLGARIIAQREATSDVDTSAALVFWTYGDDHSGQESMRIDDVGRVMIGTTSETHMFAVAGADAGTDVGDGIAVVQNSSSTTGKIALMCRFSGDSTIGSTDYFINFRDSAGFVGGVHSEVTYGTFTGGHPVPIPLNAKYELLDYTENYNSASFWILEEGSEYNNEPILRQGMIVASTGEIWSIGNTNGISNALPYVKVTTSQKDKKVFGVYNGPSHPDLYGLNTKTYLMNAVGEGRMLVTDTEGNIEAGDYICSSDRYGCGEKQDDDLLHNYTIAKATEDIDFSSIDIDPEFGYKVALVGCTYHCG